MFAPAHLPRYALFHWEMAFCWAVEPAAVSEPEAHAMELVLAELALPELLSSVPQAASTSAPAATMTAAAGCLTIFT
jgi:hypothetical protein